MRNDPDFLELLWLWNQRSAQETPTIHRRIARWLMARREAGDRRLLLMAFRGCGKSTLIGLWCAWLLLNNPFNAHSGGGSRCAACHAHGRNRAAHSGIPPALR
jgi:hypothetical protein